MLHEGVHAFTATLLKMSAPTWYTEGIAEWLATHRLTKEKKAFEHTPIPSLPDDVEQLGRIEMIHAFPVWVKHQAFKTYLGFVQHVMVRFLPTH